MDLYPVEIWQNIFRLVCLDSGRSLSLVPKYFNRDPKRFIFQSIYLKSIDQIETFAAILDRIGPNLQLVDISTYPPMIWKWSNWTVI